MRGRGTIKPRCWPLRSLVLNCTGTPAAVTPNTANTGNTRHCKPYSCTYSWKTDQNCKYVTSSLQAELSASPVAARTLETRSRLRKVGNLTPSHQGTCIVELKEVQSVVVPAQARRLPRSVYIIMPTRLARSLHDDRPCKVDEG